MCTGSRQLPEAEKISDNASPLFPNVSTSVKLELMARSELRLVANLPMARTVLPVYGPGVSKYHHHPFLKRHVFQTTILIIIDQS